MVPADELLERWGVDRTRPYVHAGLVLWVSKEMLEDWRNACAATPAHALWEQNVLTAPVMRDPASVELLDARRWQVYDEPLAAVQVPDPRDPHGLVMDGGPVMTVHATSRQGHHRDANLALNFGPHVLRGYMRLFANPALQRIQLRNLAAAVTRDRDAMQAPGVLRPRD